MQFTVTVKTDARAFLIEIAGVDTTDNSFAIRMSIEAVVEETTDNSLDITLTRVNVAVSVTETLRVFPNDLSIDTVFDTVAVIVLVNALIMVLVFATITVSEIR
jgi:hypothetical protein